VATGVEDAAAAAIAVGDDTDAIVDFRQTIPAGAEARLSEAAGALVVAAAVLGMGGWRQAEAPKRYEARQECSPSAWGSGEPPSIEHRQAENSEK
jgi:hypothetical protein